MSAVDRSGRAVTGSLFMNDLACKRCSEKRGQASVQTNSPILMSLLYGR